MPNMVMLLAFQARSDQGTGSTKGHGQTSFHGCGHGQAMACMLVVPADAPRLNPPLTHDQAS